MLVHLLFLIGVDYRLELPGVTSFFFNLLDDVGIFYEDKNWIDMNVGV